MKRVKAFIIILLTICVTACKQPVPSGMEKAFDCVVGETTLEEFCDLFPEDSYEWGLSWISPGIEFMGLQPSEIISVILKEGSYQGTNYQKIGLDFDNRVLSDITFHVFGNAGEIENVISIFREEFSPYYDFEAEKPTLGGGISHRQVFFDDGLTTIMLWSRDYSQCEQSGFNPTTEIELEISIMNTQMKKDWIKTCRLKRAKRGSIG
jgi:hypothetical protein